MGARLFDSHCHLSMEEFAADLETVLANSLAAGVEKILLASYDIESSKKSLELARANTPQEPELLASCGVHPHDAETIPDALPEELLLLAEDPNVVALGEMGLDYFYDNSPRQEQLRVFELQIQWALKIGKPVIVHIRNSQERSSGDAYAAAMEMLRPLAGRPNPGVIHCFSGNRDDAALALDMGFFISFAGPVTYPKAAELRDVAAYVPLDRLLCETDSPYLAPQKKRGRRNEPALVRDVYEKIAEVRSMELATLAEAVWRNSERLLSSKLCTYK